MSIGALIYNTVRGSVDYAPQFYPSCALVNPPSGTDPDSLNCRIVWCPDTADVYETWSGVDGFFDLLNQDCNPAGGGSGTDAWTLQVTNNPDYEPERKALRKREDGSVEKRSHARHLPKRQQDGVSLQGLTALPTEFH